MNTTIYNSCYYYFCFTPSIRLTEVKQQVRVFVFFGKSLKSVSINYYNTATQKRDRTRHLG